MISGLVWGVYEVMVCFGLACVLSGLLVWTFGLDLPISCYKYVGNVAIRFS